MIFLSELGPRKEKREGYDCIYHENQIMLLMKGRSSVAQPWAEARAPTSRVGGVYRSMDR